MRVLKPAVLGQLPAGLCAHQPAKSRPDPYQVGAPFRTHRKGFGTVNRCADECVYPCGHLCLRAPPQLIVATAADIQAPRPMGGAAGALFVAAHHHDGQ